VAEETDLAMKSLLMHRDRQFDPRQELPWNVPALTADLELNTLLGAMAGGDAFLFDVCRTTILAGMSNDADTILYRQAILNDCLKNPAIIRDLYALAVEAMERKRRGWLGIIGRYPGGILRDAIELLEMLVEMLWMLRGAAESQAGRFQSEGFTTFFAMIERELSKEYLAGVQDHLKELKFRKGVLLSAELGEANEGVNYLLRRPAKPKGNWLRRLFSRRPPGYSFRLHPRDEGGARILSEMRDFGINRVANALAQSSDHVRAFFDMLRTELAFYVGCLNLHERLAAKGKAVCFPRPAPAAGRRLHFAELYDPCLSLHLDGRVVSNTANADDKNLVIITGANQGGKSVFLRSVGLAQLMMQCGMFVAAEQFEGSLCTSLATHYKREEDATMTSGKLDEELARMSAIADHLGPNAMLLCNESFAATNEREGSEIARQIVAALLERRIRVCFVTHLYGFATAHRGRTLPDVLLLRAERLPDGTRTFKLTEGEPLETSYGEDLYRDVFPDDISAYGRRKQVDLRQPRV
jgi:hypothetical protein